VRAAEQGVDHSAWNALLKRYVDDGGLVDYTKLLEDREALDAYLEELAEVPVGALTREEQLSFWINAYNACVANGVLKRQPLRSVQKVPGFFNRVRYRVGGESLTLDRIEERGRVLGEWRIHFTLVCASTSCPPLRNEAYTAGQLEEQLTEQAARFLANRTHGLRLESGVLRVSKIFQWYATDFVPHGRLEARTLLPLLRPYLEPALLQAIEDTPRLRLSFLEYDWTLNNQGE
jgi:hypothetical protein